VYIEVSVKRYVDGITIECR